MFTVWIFPRPTKFERQRNTPSHTLSIIGGQWRFMIYKEFMWEMSMRHWSKKPWELITERFELQELLQFQTSVKNFPSVLKSLLHDRPLHLRPCNLWGWLPDEGRAFMQTKFLSHGHSMFHHPSFFYPLTNPSSIQVSSFQGEAWLHYPLQFMYSHIVTTFRHICSRFYWWNMRPFFSFNI